MPTTYVPASGRRAEKQIPSKVQRRTLNRTPHKRRICRDGRAYEEVPFTIIGDLAVARYGPAYPADRDYWIARITLAVGRHDEATHPNDGTPSGQSILANMRRVSVDETDDSPILNSDSRLRIAPDHHRDAVNDEEDGKYDINDFNIHHLEEGEHIYPDILQVGSGRPGTLTVITIILVPIP